MSHTQCMSVIRRSSNTESVKYINMRYSTASFLADRLQWVHIYLIKSSPINLKLFQFPPFAPQDSITILNLLQHPVMLLNPFIYVINGPEIHVGASAPASFFLWVPPR
mmetsp:Transcript_9151/g.25755  ORF Transcript_9151/g.25755 Transcript_9151/m.25755 type:complete len:108 (+) Transcript_9151:134-457(+)